MRRRPFLEILIVKFEALGDVLRTTCLLEPLHKRGPCRVSWLTSPPALPLLKNNPQLERVMGLNLEDRAATRRLAGRLAGRFDLVLSLEENIMAASVAQAACRDELVGVRLEDGRLRYTPSSAPYYDMSLLNRGADGGIEAANALKAANRLSYAQLWLKILGLRLPPRPGPVLRLNARDRAAAHRLAKTASFRRPGPVLALNSGAGARWPAKQISEEKSARIAVSLGRNFGGPLLLLGGKERIEMARNRRIAARVSRLDAGIKPILTPYLPLRSFAAMLELCDALVSTDSLALHLAAALGRPAVALVGPTSAAELDFFGRGRALQPSGGCSCFYKALCTRAIPCLDDIAESRIVAEVRRCLS